MRTRLEVMQVAINEYIAKLSGEGRNILDAGELATHIEYCLLHWEAEQARQDIEKGEAK